MKPLVTLCLSILLPVLSSAAASQQLVEGGLADADIAVLVRQAIVSDAARSAMSADSLGRAANVRPDVDVARDVQVVLEMRLGARLSGLSVTCRDGIVVLAGSASSTADASTALTLADAVPGARSVESRLAVAGATTASSTTSTAARAPVGPGKAGPFSFLTKDRLAGAGVSVEVERGVVRLRGTASSLRAKEMATATSRLVTGVRSVVNSMEIRPASRAEDDRLVKLIERRIEWSTDVRSSFAVEVKDGIARVSGTAHQGPPERDEVVHLAASTQGILVVDDQIVVP